MEQVFEDACKALRKLSDHILAEHAKAAQAETLPKYSKSYKQMFGLVLNVQDLARMARNLASDIESAPGALFTEEAKEYAKDIPNRVNVFIELNVPKLFVDADRDMAYISIITALQEYRVVLSLGNGPSADLKYFMDARDDVVEYISEAKVAAERIPELMRKADNVIDRAAKSIDMATTAGLAAEFVKRAKQLRRATWFWTTGLFFVLASGSLVDYYILNNHTNLQQKFPAMPTEPGLASGIIGSSHLLLVLPSIATIWLAWLSTKQIGQLFRLREDYSFKATIANAYQGYKLEAGGFGEELKSRLFGITLNRLDEHPLRFVEQDSHGSPWHELLGSRLFSKTKGISPDIIQILKAIAHGIECLSNSAPAEAKPSSSTDTEKNDNNPSSTST